MEVSCFCPGCGERFSSSYKSIGIYTECDHLVHLDSKCSGGICGICGIKSNVFPGSNLLIGTQAYTNVQSITRKPIKWTWTDRLRGIGRLIRLIPVIVGLGFRLGFGLLTREYISQINLYLCGLLGINIQCSLQSYSRLLDSTYKRILIAPHTNYHDALVIGYILNKYSLGESIGIIAAPIANSIIFGRAALKVFPHIIVGSGTLFDKSDKQPKDSGSGSTSQIEKFFDLYPKESRLMIFPEGMLTHESTLSKFRSGGFVTSYPVQPIIIKYGSKSRIFDLLGFDILCQESIDVEVEVLDPIERKPTQSIQEFVEHTRNLMSKIGKFTLSNVSNKKI